MRVGEKRKCGFCDDTGWIEPSWLQHLAAYAETPFPDQDKLPKREPCICPAGRAVLKRE
jgi:hypothetical protein